jgi:hypothetical protein
MWRFVFLLPLIALVAGCGPAIEFGQVSGTVRAGGLPLPGVLVTFIPEANGPAAAVRSMGVTDDNGQYRLKTESQRDGAVLGQHRVIIEDMAIYSAPRSADGTVLAHPPERFPPAYSDPLASPLVREVAAGSQTFDLDLETNQ